MPFSPTRKLKNEALLRSERFLSLPPPLRLFALSLLLYVDQAGREVASSRVLQQALYEFDEDVTTDSIDEMLLALEAADWLLLYEHGRRLYLQMNPELLALYVSMDKRDSAPHPPPPGALGAFSGRAAAEGKGEGGEPGDAAAWTLDPEMPPPAGCRKHPNNTGLIPCGPCAGARKIHADFIAGNITHAEAVAAWSTPPTRPRTDEE